MADVVNVGVNLDAFSHAISGIQALRSSVSRVFESLKDGMKNRETLEGREKQFIAEFQDNLQAVNRDLNELERLSGLVGRPSESHPLHNSGLLSLDPVQDKTPLYSQLLQAYKWSNKLQYHAGLASSLLNQQSLKRSANQMGASAKRRPKVQPSTLVLPPQYVDDVISRIGRMFPDMTIELFRPNGTSAVLLVIKHTTTHTVQVCSDQVTGVCSDQVTGVCSDQITGVFRPGNRCVFRPGNRCVFRPGNRCMCSDQVTGVCVQTR
ncbi:mediator of RNA polymerase II transcription subunit 27 isoform X3 [Epinephelus moara]|uniref:mediator of RNA polymerase II transcription subunit 27 isoform X3 n=1 Tax=Epinephelus moara TaxID=300413 RepID=UPI00214F5352|nr:mediator of RNA polymerase II transcription subunit 27 isoform X3 [Epinephelus moara]